MLSEYRAWLESELQTRRADTQDAYALGEVEMLKRAIARLDSQPTGSLPLTVHRSQAASVLTALEMLAQRETNLDPALRSLREMLKEALSDKSSGDVGGA